MGGANHLTISDILGTEGVREVRTVSFYLQNEFMYKFEMPEGDWESPPVYFALSDPVPLKNRNNSPIGDDPGLPPGEESGEELSAEEMTRALDFGGNTPVRTEIFSRDGLTVYGEHILLADQTVMMSFLLENKSEENRIVRFYGLNTDDRKFTAFSDNEISYASSRRRIIVDAAEYGEIENNSVNNMSLLIWQDTKPLPDTQEQEEAGSQSGEEEKTGSDQTGGNEDKTRARGLPIIQQVDLSLPAGTAFNADGGRSFGFEDTGITVTCLTDEKAEGDFFEKKVACPENPDQYRKQVSFRLPDSLSGEEKNSVQDVIVAAYRDCTAEVSPEDAKDIQDSLSKEGIDDPSPLCLQFLTYAGMKRSEENPDTFSGSLSGLMCVHQDQPEISYIMLESVDEDGKTRFIKKDSDVFDTWYIVPKDWCDDTFIDGVEYDMTITLQGGSASLDEFVIHDRKYNGSEYAVPYSIAPLNWFESMKYTLTALAFVHEENGTLQNQPEGMSTGYYTVDTEIPVNGGNRTLELLPFEECGSGIRLVYYVYFEDGSCSLYDGGSLF